MNLGNPDELTILEFAERIADLTGSPRNFVFHALPEDDPKRRKPDISKAKRLLGWEPRVSLEAGLAETIEYFRDLSLAAAPGW